MRILISIILFVGLFFVLFLSAGYLAPVEYQKTKSTTFDDKPNSVWNAVIDIEKYIDRKKNINKLEIIEKQFGVIKKWKEYYRNETLEYEILQQENPKLFIINVKDDFRKINRDIEYYVEKTDTRTKLTVSEVSQADHIFWRGVITLLGRDNFIDRQLKWVRVALFDNLLNEK